MLKCDWSSLWKWVFMFVKTMTKHSDSAMLCFVRTELVVSIKWSAREVIKVEIDAFWNPSALWFGKFQTFFSTLMASLSWPVNISWCSIPAADTELLTCHQMNLLRDARTISNNNVSWLSPQLCACIRSIITILPHFLHQWVYWANIRWGFLKCNSIYTELGNNKVSNYPKPAFCQHLSYILAAKFRLK